MVIEGGGSDGLERVERSTFRWRRSNCGSRSLALGSSIVLLPILMARVLRLASRLVTVMLCTGAIRFGDVEEMICLVRSGRLRGLCWLRGPILRLTHRRRFAELGLLGNRRTVLLAWPPRGEGLFWCAAFSGHIYVKGLLKDPRF